MTFTSRPTAAPIQPPAAFPLLKNIDNSSHHRRENGRCPQKHTLVPKTVQRTELSGLQRSEQRF